jgi:hypothetical protein
MVLSLIYQIRKPKKRRLTMKEISKATREFPEYKISVSKDGSQIEINVTVSKERLLIEKTEKFNRIYYKYRAKNMNHDTAMECAHKYMQRIIIEEIRNTVFKNK